MPIAVATSMHTVVLGEQARDALLSAIVEGELLPGEALREAPLATALGISRTPVREALHRLAEIDLVRVDPGRGYRVTPLEPGRLTDMVEVAAVLAGMAARLSAPHLTTQDRGWLESAEVHVLSLESSYSGTHPFGPHAIDLFVERCGNPVLREALGTYRPHLLRLVRRFGASVPREVRAGRVAGFVAALRTGDAHLLDDAVRADYRQVGGELVHALEQSQGSPATAADRATVRP